MTENVRDSKIHKTESMMQITHDEARYIYIWMMQVEPSDRYDLKIRNRITNYARLGYEPRG